VPTVAAPGDSYPNLPRESRRIVISADGRRSGATRKRTSSGARHGRYSTAAVALCSRTCSVRDPQAKRPASPEPGACRKLRHLPSEADEPGNVVINYETAVSVYDVLRRARSAAKSPAVIGRLSEM